MENYSIPDQETRLYRRNLVLILIVAIFIIPALGGYGFASFTAGPSWLHFFWLIPGWIVWLAVALGGFWLRRNPHRWRDPIVREAGALADAAQPYLYEASKALDDDSAERFPPAYVGATRRLPR